MDSTARLWDVESGEETAYLAGHSAEVICLSFNTYGDCLLTGGLYLTRINSLIPVTAVSKPKIISFGPRIFRQYRNDLASRNWSEAADTDRAQR